MLQVETEPPAQTKGTKIQPAPAKSMEENPEQQAEMTKALLEALGSGGVDGVKRMLQKFEAPRSESKKASGTDAPNFMDLQQATPEPLKEDKTTPQPVKPSIVKKEKGLQLAISDRPSRTQC